MIRAASPSVRLALCAGLLFSFPISAADAQPRALSPADRLFEEGRALYALGHYDEACAKFDESETLEPAVGTLLNLGDCAVRVGATATAWQRYREAAALAARSADAEREAAAKRSALELEGRLSKILLRRPRLPLPPDARVERDGGIVPTADIETAVVVDPGTHRVVVSASGHKTWSTLITVGQGPAIVEVPLPVLEDDAPPPSPSTGATMPVALSPATSVFEEPKVGLQHQAGSSGILPWLVGGAGLVLLGAGAAFVVEGRSIWSDVTKSCPSGVCPDQATANTMAPREQDAARDATIGTIGLGLGGAALAGGVVLYLLGLRSASGLDVSGGPTSRGGTIVASWLCE
jgi:hypothetical protein